VGVKDELHSQLHAPEEEGGVLNFDVLEAGPQASGRLLWATALRAAARKALLARQGSFGGGFRPFSGRLPAPLGVNQGCVGRPEHRGRILENVKPLRGSHPARATGAREHPWRVALPGALDVFALR